VFLSILEKGVSVKISTEPHNDTSFAGKVWGRLYTDEGK